MNTSRDWRNLAVTLTLLTVVCLVILAWPHRDALRLPYHDSFGQHRAREWKPLGGSWRIQDDAMINWSDEQGSKLVTGSPDWANYQVSSDLRLLAHGGDIGLIVRVSQAEIGTDAYRGYYIGLRSSDSAIVIGRANYSWITDRPVPFGERIQSGRWYRLHVVAFGCTIAVEASDPVTGVFGYSALKDDPQHCILKGQLGLRSTDTSSAWRNVVITSADAENLQQVLTKVPEILHPDYPIREADLARMRSKYFPDVYPFGNDSATAQPDPSENRSSSLSFEAVPLVSVLSLRTEPPSGKPLRLRGAVTSIAPVYLQDATGGVKLQVADPGALCIGDEVEVAGQPSGEGRNLVFVASQVQVPSQRVPLSPTSITPAQAVSGTHEGSLVEITGEVVSDRRLPDGSSVLRLKSDEQDFEALMQADPFAQQANWSPGSTVRIRGICTIDPDEAAGSSFAVLVQSAADVTLLAGPSWLVGWRLFLLVVLGLLLVVLAFYLYTRADRLKIHAIANERERLSHEMHDTLAQSFAGVSYHLQGLRKAVHEENNNPETLAQELDIAYKMVAGTHREASALIAALHPNAQTQSDLLSLIEGAALQMFEKRGPLINLHRRGVVRFLPPSLADVLFRVGLEAVANVLRHSEAKSIDLTMVYTPTSVELVIEDNGCGFIPESAKFGFGLQSMKRRCDSVNAKLTIESNPGKGTRIAVTSETRSFSGFRFWRLLTAWMPRSTER
jgi:signal transduction histidine kinase